MSLLKRKPSSLDPIQKQRKYRQCQYYSILEKCLQIPNDDKLILRKNIEEQEERLISLMEKYRKQIPKDFKDIQIYLRKYIQKYKIDHPKYPTLKLTNNCSNSYSMHKRNSFSFSIDTSKLTIDLGHSTSQMKQSFHIPLKKQLFSPSIKQQKPVLRLNSQMSREQQRNYEELIRKRKTQKLKISEHKVSVTIQNESHSANFYQDVLNFKDHKVINKDESKQKEQKVKSIPKTATCESLITECKMNLVQLPVIQKNEVQRVDFLQTMRLRMKIDEKNDQEENQKLPNQKQANQLLPFQNPHIPLIKTEDSIFQMEYHQKSLQTNENAEQFSSVKRKLFPNKQNLKSSQISEQKNSIQSKKDSRFRKPMQEINFENTFSSIKKLQDMNSRKLPLQSSRNYQIEKVISTIQGLNEKQKFNSGHNNSQDSILKQLFHNYNNQSIIEHQIIGRSKAKLGEESRINNEKDLKDIESQYVNSQRKMSELLYSHRMADQNNRSFINSFSKDMGSFSKDKEDKQNKPSSRMIFSHRMQEVISGRKQQNLPEQHMEKPSSVNSSYSFRDKKKTVSKLQFWARIQSTINQ